MKLLRMLSIILPAIMLCTDCLPLSAQTTYQPLTILGKNHTASSGEVMGQYLLSLLDEEAAKWVESIDCANVTVFGASYLGVVLAPNADTDENAYVRFNLKRNLRMVPSMVFVYGKSLNQTSGKTIVPMDLICNGDYSFTIDPKFKDLPTDRASLLSILSQTAITQRGTYASVINNLDIAGGLTSIELNISSSDGFRPRYQFVGFGVTYTSLTDADIATVIDEPECTESCREEYFDIAGRQLPQPPAKGLYLLRKAGKVKKMLAR